MERSEVRGSVRVLEVEQLWTSTHTEEKYLMLCCKMVIRQIRTNRLGLETYWNYYYVKNHDQMRGENRQEIQSRVLHDGSQDRWPG